MYQYKINKIIFNDDKPIDLNQLTIIVGPNNSGKSRILKDILSLATEHDPTTKLLKEVDLLLPNSIEEFLNQYPIKTISDNKSNQLRTLNADLVGTHAIGLGSNDLIESVTSWFKPNHPKFKRGFSNYFGKFLLTFLSTEERLKLILESPQDDVNMQVTNLLQAVYKEGRPLEEEIRKVIKDTFKIDIKLDFSIGIKLLFRIGEDLSSVPIDPRDARPIFEKLEKLDDQGDGIKSFLTTFIALKVGTKPVLLLDEPEAFLHPPQAMRLGELIAEISNKNQQIIIATHSSDFLKGVINKRQDITLIRIDREGDKCLRNLLDSKDVQKFANDPLLNSTRILEGLFYKGTVISEADADSVFYQRISRQIRNTDDIHYTHAHNKQTVYKAAHPYKTLGIKHAVIVDFDILKEKSEFKKIIDDFKLKSEVHAELLNIQENIKKEIETISPKEQLEKLLIDINNTLTKFKSEDLEKQDVNQILLEARKRLEDNITNSKPWSQFKKTGYKSLKPENQKQFLQLAEICKKNGLFIVPNGELETWLIDHGLEYSNRKSKWITSALELLPRIKIENDENPWSFINEVHTYLLNNIIEVEPKYPEAIASSFDPESGTNIENT